MNVIKFWVASAAALAEIPAGAEEVALWTGCSNVAGTPIFRRSVAEGYSISYSRLKLSRSPKTDNTPGFLRSVLYCPSNRRQVGVYLSIRIYISGGLSNLSSLAELDQPTLPG